MHKSRHLEKLEHFKAWNPSELLEASRRDYEPADKLTRKTACRNLDLLCGRGWHHD